MSGRAEVAIVGAGAAGCFAARVLEELRPQGRIVLLEKSGEPLRKVAISGGGRCNVTNAQADPREFARAYPRGQRELLGPLHRFGSREAIAWFEEHGVPLKTEDDGRVFPVSDDARSIVECLRPTRAELRLHAGVASLERRGADFLLRCDDDSELVATRVIFASGGLARTAHYDALARLGHSIEPPVPSLFAFHCAGDELRELAGLSVPDARLRLHGADAAQRGPLLLTHRGLSGPVTLRLSAVAARQLSLCGHRFAVELCWNANWTSELFDELLRTRCAASGARLLAHDPPAPLPRRLWERLIRLAGIPDGRKSAELTREERARLVGCACGLRLAIAGQSPNKEEFVTCGGVRLREVDFRTMESRIARGLHFAGEILDLDALTGGFNFQAAWTTAWIAAQSIARALDQT